MQSQRLLGGREGTKQLPRAWEKLVPLLVVSVSSAVWEKGNSSLAVSISNVAGIQPDPLTNGISNTPGIKKMWCIYTMEYYSATKKERNNAICSNMDATRDYTK